jgi:glycosyltransferase involved in cell wall biosynthesis
VDLVLVGDGALRPLVEEAVSRNPHIHYLGRLPYVSVPGVVANAVAATVLTYAPERAGYSPLKLYEAMACGVPIICSDTPGQAEYVREERAGIVVPPDDPAAVANAVAEIAGNPAEAQAMGYRGMTAVEEKYSWEARARQRLQVIISAIESNRARS